MYDLGKQFHFNVEMAKSKDEAIVKGKNYRFTILSERLIRIEYSKLGVFLDGPTTFALCRNFPVPKFTVNEDGKYLEIVTKYFKLSYTKESPITESSLRISLNNTETMWYYGHPEIKTYDGALISLEGKDTYTKGLYSIEGFASIDDSTNMIIDPVGNLVNRVKDSLDIYVFMYNEDFEAALSDYIMLTGKPQMLPRYAFGNWWSKNYAYNEESLRKLFNRFDKEEIPISVFLMDKDWHITNNNQFVTGYTFEKNLIPNPEIFIETMHKRGIRIGVNINPIEGIYPHEESYSKVLEYIKVAPNTVINFAPFNTQFLDVFFKIILHPLESKGIDFFWLDYPNKDKLTAFLMTHYMYLDSGREESKRGMLMSRNPIIAPHRYGVLYSGRSKVGFDTLRKIPYINTSAANIGVSWWSHDVGGFYDGVEDGELYLRSIQLGCYSPIFRISVDEGRYYKREPWRWDVNTSQIVKNYMQLRNKLVPYIYSEAFKYYDKGIPLVVPLYHKEKELFYDAYFKNEYHFGSELLVSPLTTPKDRLMNRVIHKVYIPDGLWYDFKTGKKFPAGTYVSFYKDEDYPVFAKSGSIIPMATKIDNALKIPEELEIHVFPGRSNTYDLYEDDGISNLYKSGYYLKTQIDYNYQANNYTLIIRALEGKSGIVPDKRNYKIRFRNTRATNEVVANFNGTVLETNCYEDENDFIVEIKNVNTVGQLSINCKGKAIEIDSIRLINEDIDTIISDLEVETRLKNKIASILFSNLPINKKRIQIRKLKKQKLDTKFIKMFLRLLEYVEQI